LKHNHKHGWVHLSPFHWDKRGFEHNLGLSIDDYWLILMTLANMWMQKFNCGVAYPFPTPLTLPNEPCPPNMHTIKYRNAFTSTGRSVCGNKQLQHGLPISTPHDVV
jgi:hypothetical protein